MLINDLMEKSQVAFGTSGARGLVTDMTDSICHAYTTGFLQYLEQIGEINRTSETVAIAGDLRPSTKRIMTAVAQAISDKGYKVINCGYIPSPAITLYGLNYNCPSIMITGSHIPDDRNGIKFNKCSGEILKIDEEQIRSQNVEVIENLCPSDLPSEDKTAIQNYVNRYTNIFPNDILEGIRIGIYQHSAVGREVLVHVFQGLGAEVIPLGFSNNFIPVDTEAVREEDHKLAKEWVEEYSLDTIITTDGDSDRPLISDENGIWLRGDILGILAAKFLNAETVITPVSSNTAVEESNLFNKVYRTRIGSPYVIANMIEASLNNDCKVVGYEANGGFLTNSFFELYNKSLPPLPTRDAILPMLSLIILSKEKGISISQEVEKLPKRYTASDRIENFPLQESKKILERYKDINYIEDDFGDIFGDVLSVDDTDGLRVTFANNDVLHLRPSGNAPEFRCYNESDSLVRLSDLQQMSIRRLKELRG